LKFLITGCLKISVNLTQQVPFASFFFKCSKILVLGKSRSIWGSATLVSIYSFLIVRFTIFPNIRFSVWFCRLVFFNFCECYVWLP